MNSLISAKLALAIYKDDKKNIRDFKTFSDLGYTKILPIEVNEDYAVVAVSKDNCIVVVAGSDDWKDWFDDLDFVTMKTELGKVHEGFYKSYLRLCDGVYKAIRDLASQVINVHFIGHSKGAAIAELLCVNYARSNPPKVFNLYTFGCPKVGLSGYVDLVKMLNIETKCYNGKYDPVPKEPTWFLFMPSIFFKYTFPQIDLPCFHLMSEYIECIEKANIE